MPSDPNITLAFLELTEQSSQAFPSFGELHMRLVKVRKDVLKESLRSLISDVSEILEAATDPSERIRPSKVTIAADITSEGGIAWIGSVKSSLASGITLTFDLHSNR